MKTFCSVHCFNYSGHSCPFCEKDRVASLVKRLIKNVKVEVQESKQDDSIDYTQADMDKMLNNLKAKFNRR